MVKRASFVSALISKGSAETPLGSPISSTLIVPSKALFCSSLSRIWPVPPWGIELRTSEPANGVSATSKSNNSELNQVGPVPKFAEATTQSFHFLSAASALTLRLKVASLASAGIFTAPPDAIPGGEYSRNMSTGPLNSPLRVSLIFKGNTPPRRAAISGTTTSI